MKSYVIFDLDGTLLNSIDDLAQATNHALAAMDFPQHGMWVYPNMVGNGVTKLIERALPDDARSEKNIRAALAHFTEYYNEHCCDATTPYPGIDGRDENHKPLFSGRQLPRHPRQRGRHAPQARPFDSVQGSGHVPHA